MIDNLDAEMMMMTGALAKVGRMTSHIFAYGPINVRPQREKNIFEIMLNDRVCYNEEKNKNGENMK